MLASRSITLVTCLFPLLTSIFLQGCGSASPPTPTPATLGPTLMTKRLNAAIERSVWPAVYRGGGKGILVRSPFDGYEADPSKNVVPATLWVNDIFSPSQIYADNGGGNGSFCPTCCPADQYNCPVDPETGDAGPWKTIQMGYLVDPARLYDDWEHVQDSKWSNGIFYASDSNSVDERCAYFQEYDGYDCPNGWLDKSSGKWLPNSTRKGAGWYLGKGCHFNIHMYNGTAHHNIDQIKAYDSTSGRNLTGSYECECDYSFKQDWSKWVDQLVQRSSVFPGGKGPSWFVDLSACWLNNPTDMINLQNQLWWKRREWNSQQIPEVNYKQNDAVANRPYWGWNEVPVNRKIITSQISWEAVMIKLPTAACGGNGEKDSLNCIDKKYQRQLETVLNNWYARGYLADHREMVVAREVMDASTNYFRQFFCEEWTSPRQKYKLHFSYGKRCTIQRLDGVVLA